jgi:NDP-sugar pyrophosphorylase family protein
MLLVLNGDSYCRCSIRDFVAGQAASGVKAGMALVKVEDVSRFGAVQTNGASFVESFIEKGGLSRPGWINAGIYLLPLHLIQELASDRPVSLECEVFPSLISTGLYGYPCPGPFIDIGVPEEYRRAQLLFSKVMKGNP